jgi:spore coat protein H
VGGGWLKWNLRRSGGIAVLCGVACAAASVRAKDPSDTFFAGTNAPHIRIEVEGSELAELRKDHRTYVRATIREGDMVYLDVAVRLKGKLGSFRPVDERPSLTLNFDKFKAGQKFHGLDKIHLNNSVQDPACMTEILCGELFLSAGVPAARGMHARVTFDGRELGVYVLKEGFDKTFLRRHFKNADGNLYESGFMGEITEALHKNSGDEDAAAEAALAKLVQAAEELDPAKRMERLGRVLDVERFISFLALEVMICHWDGYAIRRNNYRIYHDPRADKIVFLPHGMDQVFGDSFMRLVPQFHGLVAKAVIDTPEWRQRYLDRVGTLATNVFRVDALTNRINELQRTIRPVLASINSEWLGGHDVAVESLRQRVAQRVWYLTQQLQDPESVVLKFDENGVARIAQWRPHQGAGRAVLEHMVADGSKPSLYIRADSEAPCVASWRARVMLKPGRYHFEGQLRTAGLMTASGQAVAAATLRTSGTQSSSGPITSDSTWTRAVHEFEVKAGSVSIELVCELRGEKGEAWFEADSLTLLQMAQSVR